MPRRIPKLIHQTWTTTSLPAGVVEVVTRMKLNNSDYEFRLYDDRMIDDYICNEFSPWEYNAFSRLTIGASKADFWRYCILYKQGGIYLDMDAEIVGQLDDLIGDQDACLITREGNRPFFNNWIMATVPGHPLFKLAIEKCCQNIYSHFSSNICRLTGPHGPLTDSINELYGSRCHGLIYDTTDRDLDIIFNNNHPTDSIRFYGVDMNGFARFKHDAAEDLYKEHKHWTRESDYGANKFHHALTMSKGSIKRLVQAFRGWREPLLDCIRGIMMS